VTSLRRWQSETLEAVRTDTMKVIRDADGHVTINRLEDGAETLVPRSAITARLLAELDGTLRHTVAVPPALLTLPEDAVDRLHALGYIR
jgi:hypothetical protein